tara:strand:- start:146 stop:808 length:663 start_codon:yes stop_codon:yes gene_type:complete
MLYIYCAGSLAKEIYDLAKRTGMNSNNILFVDDKLFGNKFTSDMVDILSEDQLIAKYNKEDKVIVASGEPSVRENLFTNLSNKDFNFGILIDPTSIISPSAVIKTGTIICDFCSISSDTFIDNNVLINRQSIIGHDIKIAPHAVISSTVNLGGSVTVGKASYVGMGAHVREDLKIGAYSIISMGSIVHKDVKDETIVMGNPARAMLINKEKKIFKRTSSP